MITPFSLGQYLKCDEKGNIIPDVHPSLIAEPYRDLVRMVSEEAQKSGIVHSVYLRGSVPRGLAIPGLSDIDFVYLSTDEGRDLQNHISEKALADYPHVKGIEFLRVSPKAFARVDHPQTRPYLQMLLKTQSICILGEDVTLRIEPFQPGFEMISHAFWLKDELHSIKEETLEKRKWFSRRLVRTGLELTMNRIPRFTRDLYLCYEQFSEVYPDHAPAMMAALTNALNGNIPLATFHPLIYFLHEELVQQMQSL